jgi:hypothetical protein
MTTLMIKDLSVTEELSSQEMASVRGGTFKYLPLFAPYYSSFESNLSFDASQLISQSQNTNVVNGVNVAFADDIKAHVNPTQTANNNINFR